jgi:hypothetical protein
MQAGLIIRLENFKHPSICHLGMYYALALLSGTFGEEGELTVKVANAIQYAVIPV